MAQAESHEIGLAETFAEIARSLLDEADVDATLRRICQLAEETVPNCEAAGISISERGRVTSVSCTNDTPRIVDAIQSLTQQGPCVDAIVEHEVFVTGRLSEEQRWPDFSQRAFEEAGVESILSLRLFVREDTMGALNLYSTAVDAFDHGDIAVGSVFASHAAVALAGAERQANLEAMAASRDVIGIAKGIIMAQRLVTDDEAFDILRRASQRTNLKLREVAERVVHRSETQEPG
jgi:transcriptional regulator with GAF, ATPase, and Fis domain